MTRTRNNNSGGSSPLMEFIKKYALILGVLVLGFPYLMRYFKDQETEDVVNNNQEEEKKSAVQVQNPTTQLTGLNKITTRTELHDIARNVAFHLGTNIQIKNASWGSWLNPRGWTENDEKAYLELKRINYPASLDLVVKCYYYLTQRNMLDDVKKLLDEEYKKKLPLFK